MTKLKIILVGILIAFFNLNANAQGVKIYKSDKEVITIPYSELDSIVAYDIKQHVTEWVDLGLPSGILWATKNVGATSPEDYGDYFAWGETSPKDSYTEKNYKHSLGFNEEGDWLGGRDLGDISGNPQYDAARANWGAPARMPKHSEIRELIDNCTTTWTTENGVNGRLVTGPNGNSIFLPTSGYRNGTSLYLSGEIGCFWSSTPYEDSDIRAFYLDVDIYTFGSNWVNRGLGHTVRPVRD